MVNWIPRRKRPWDRVSLASDEIDAYRRSYIQALKPVFEETLAELVSLDDLTLSYRGWDKDRDPPWRFWLPACCATSRWATPGGTAACGSSHTVGRS